VAIDRRVLWRGLGGSRYFEYSWLLRHIGSLRPGLRVLDVGAGPSVLPALLAHRGYTSVASDTDAGELAPQRTFRNRPGVGGRLHALVHDGARLAVRDRSCDVVICRSVLEHISVPVAAATVAELARCVARGGLLLITVPFAPRYREATPPYQSGGHQRLYDLSALEERIIAASGLAPIDRAFIGWPHRAVFRLMLRADRYRVVRLMHRWFSLVAPSAIFGVVGRDATDRAGGALLALRNDALD